MAFKPDKNIAKALKQSAPNDKKELKEDSSEKKNYSDLLNLVSKKSVRKEALSITLDSDVKANLKKLAKSNGYGERQLSTFINDYFKKLFDLTENN